jgi:hypothetical protein
LFFDVLGQVAGQAGDDVDAHGGQEGGQVLLAWLKSRSTTRMASLRAARRAAITAGSSGGVGGFGAD